MCGLRSRPRTAAIFATFELPSAGGISSRHPRGDALLWRRGYYRHSGLVLRPEISQPELRSPTSVLNQEALLQQTDRATRCVSLVNCCTTVGTSCTTNPQQIKIMELEGRSTCNKLCASNNDASTVVGVIHKLDRRRVSLPRGMCYGPVFVCLSVCLSVTNRRSTKIAKRRITQTTPHE